MAVARWIIDCKNGSYETERIGQREAEEVARWLDRQHPECKPHIVKGLSYDV